MYNVHNYVEFINTIFTRCVQILDEIYRIIHYIKTTPRLARPYKVTDELFDLSTMAMEYFKEKIEPTLPEITYFGEYTGFISQQRNNSFCGLCRNMHIPSYVPQPKDPKVRESSAALKHFAIEFVFLQEKKNANFIF